MRQANVTFHCYGLYHWTLSTLVPALSGPPLLAAGPNGTGLAMLATAAAPQMPPSTATAQGGDPAEAEMSAGEWVDACFLRHSAPWVVGYCVAYTAVFVVGVVGNCCVLRVVSRNASMKNSAFHALLVNLAVADLMVIVFCLPVTLVGHLFGLRPRDRCCTAMPPWPISFRVLEVGQSKLLTYRNGPSPSGTSFHSGRATVSNLLGYHSRIMDPISKNPFTW
ncbi:hypothetical protein MRX96_014545 [Rhipicephalus microplus]